MGIANLMGKLKHKEEAPTPMPVPKPPAPVEKKEPEPVQAESEPVRAEPEPQHRRWGAREVTRLNNDDGIILDIGENMSINIPIKRRMSLEDFLRIAERVKRIEELNMGQPSYNEHMGEYH